MKITLTDNTTLILLRGDYENGGKYSYTLIKDGLQQGNTFFSKKPLWEDDVGRDKRIRKVLDCKPSQKDQILIDAINSIPEERRVEMEAYVENTEPLAEWTYIKEVTFDDIMKAFRKLLFIENNNQQLSTLSTMLTNKMKGDPVWLMLVAPPASGKTETIRAMTPNGTMNEFAHPISLLTPNTFISGHEDAVDLLPRVHEKIMTLKDFTTILSKNADAMNEIMAQLREIYDGYMHKETGNGVSKGYECHVTSIAGVTQEIDKYTQIQSIMGARYFYCRTYVGDLERLHIANKAREISIAGNEDALRLNIANHVLSLYKDFEPENLPSIPSHIEKLIERCAIVASTLRAGVSRDFHKNVTLTPEVENPSRFSKGFTKLSRCIAYLLEKDKVDLECVSLIYQIGIDCAEKRRIDILKHVKIEKQSTKEISLASKLPHSTCNEVLEDLLMLGVINRTLELPPGKKKEQNHWKRDYNLQKHEYNSQAMYFIDEIEREIRYEHRHTSILFDDERRFSKGYTLE